MKASVSIAALLLVSWSAFATEDRYTFVQAERLEYREHADATLWDFQGWYGGDYHKLWWKTEGELEPGEHDNAELQLLYSRAWTAYFDLQFGIRYEDLQQGNLTSLVAGLQGMAPYRFEVDAAAYLSENGDLFIRAEFEREFLLTERWILQPRAEVNLSLQDVAEIAVGSGVREVALGLRLRYEFSRKFAPYVGVSWEAAYGGTADFLRASGEETRETSLLLGLRFWF